MRKLFKSTALGLAAVSAILAGGCGGGGAGSGVAPGAGANLDRGTAVVSLKFSGSPAGRSTALSRHARGVINPPSVPPYAGNIPYGTFSVLVTLTNPATGASLAPPRTVTAPQAQFGLQPLVNIQYAALPVGPFRADVAAFPSQNATGSLLASGSKTGEILALQTTSISVPLTLSVKRVVAFPSSVALDSDNTSEPIDIAAQDAGNNAVTLPLMVLSADPDIADASVTSNGTATITRGSVIGTTEVAVYEPNSSLFTVVKVANQ